MGEYLPVSSARHRTMAAKTNSDDTSDISSELRIVIVGPEGSGKSASGNTILGRRAFDEHPMGAASTADKQCHYGKSTVDGQTIVVVDTPGLLDVEGETNADVNREKFSREIVKCLLLSSPGPHAILLVIRMTRLSNRLQRTTRLIEDMFGMEAKRYITIVLTGKDDLEHENETLDEFIENAPPYLKDMLQKYPVIAMDNRASVEKKMQQTKELLSTVGGENNGVYMSNELYQSIEDILLRAESESV